MTKANLEFHELHLKAGVLARFCVTVLLMACVHAAPAAACSAPVFPIGCASDADLDKLRNAATALSDEISALRARESVLLGARNVTAAPPPAAGTAPLNAGVTPAQPGCATKGELEALQRRFEAEQDELADLAVRITEWENSVFSRAAKSGTIEQLQLGGN
jgi:hypothetical protein